MRALFVLPLLLAAHPALASESKPEGRKVTIIPTSWSLHKHGSRSTVPKAEEIHLKQVVASQSRPLWYEMGDGWSGGLKTKFRGVHSHSGAGLGLRLKF